MRTINPMAKAWSNCAKQQHAKELATARFFKSKKDIKSYMEAYHKFARTLSDQPTGETKIMSGREAKDLNDSLFDVFMLAVDKNIQGRSLERWKMIEKFTQHNNEQ